MPDGREAGAELVEEEEALDSGPSAASGEEEDEDEDEEEGEGDEPARRTLPQRR